MQLLRACAPDRARRRRAIELCKTAAEFFCHRIMLRIRRGWLLRAIAGPIPPMNEIVPADPKVALRRAGRHRARGGQRGFPRDSAWLCARNIVSGSGGCRGGRVGIVANQPVRVGGRAGHRRFGQVRRGSCASATRSTFRADVGGRAGLLAGRGAGARGNHPTGPKLLLPTRQPRCPKITRGSAQGVWGRVHRMCSRGTGRGPRGCVATAGGLR